MHVIYRHFQSSASAIWTGALAVLLLTAGCGGGHAGSQSDGEISSPAPTSTPSPAPVPAPVPAPPPVAAGFSVAVTPSNLNVGQGQEGMVEVTVQRDVGFTEPVNVTLLSPPAGVTADPMVLKASQTRAVLSIRLGAELAVGSVFELDLAATAAGTTHVASSHLSVSAPQAHAQALIAAALDAGTLDLGTALLYRAYALLGDKRLPDAYLGAGSAEEDSLLFDEIGQRFASLPTARQEALRPFQVRPADPLSVWNAPPAANANATATASSVKKQPLRMSRLATSVSTCATATTSATWISKRSASYPVRVWAQCTGVAETDADSLGLIDQMLAVLDKVYTPMTMLMGEPLLDLEGDDHAIDFYILDDGRYVNRRTENFKPNGLASTYADHPETERGKGASAFVTLRRSALFTSRFHNTVIHEFFHVLQRAHNNEFSVKLVAGNPKAYELHWFIEASAAWASAHFDRTVGSWVDGRGAYSDVYFRFKDIFLPGHEALNAPGGSASTNSHDYSAFIWPYFLEQETGNAAFMKAIWNGLDSVSDFDAADAVIDGVYPFEANFRRFALRNINAELGPDDPLPLAKRYVSLDREQFVDDGKEPPYLRAALVADQDYAGEPLDLRHLSARYVRLTVPGDTRAIRKVTVDVRELLPADGLAVQALVMTDNGWLAEPIDIGPDKLSFCFDKGPSTAAVRGSFKEILLIVSNHALKSAGDIAGKLKVSPKSAPCAEVWEGTITEVARNDTPISSSVITTKVDVVLEFDDTADANANEIPYRLKSGTYTIDARFDQFGTDRPCRSRGTGAGALPLAPYQPLVPSGGGAKLTIFSDTLQYIGSGLSVVPLTTVDNCNDNRLDVTSVDPTYTLFWWNASGAGQVSADGYHIQHSATTPSGVSYNIRLDKRPGGD